MFFRHRGGLDPNVETQQSETDDQTAEQEEKFHNGSFHTYFDNKKANLQDQRDAIRAIVGTQKLPDQIFAGFLVYMNGDTGKTPKHQLEEILVLRGARIQDWPNKYTTHEVQFLASKFRLVLSQWLAGCIFIFAGVRLFIWLA